MLSLSIPWNWIIQFHFFCLDILAEPVVGTLLGTVFLEMRTLIEGRTQNLSRSAPTDVIAPGIDERQMQNREVPMPRRAVVVMLDQLSRRCLGCYGHEWIDTPHLDRLAARGVVFDQCFASPMPESELRDAALNLTERLRDQGTVVRWLHEMHESESDELDAATFAQLVSAAEEELIELSRDRESSWLLGLDCSGIGWPGLATAQFVELYGDELEEEVPAELVASREVEVMYAALLTQFDHLLGRLLTAIERLFGESSPLIVILAAHGESVCEVEMLSPFAEHLAEQSAGSGGLRDELVHPPLLIASATSESLGSRRQELVTPSDVLPTLGEWFGRADLVQDVSSNDARSLGPLLRNETCDWRLAVVLQDDEGHAAVRTDDLFYVAANITEQLEAEGSGDRTQQDEAVGSLFLKPEDVWEVNDVADQRPEQVAVLRTVLMDGLRSRQQR